MSKELFFIGAPREFKPGVLIYPPTVKEVIENDYFAHYRKILTQSQEEIEDEFINAKKQLDVYPTPIEFLLNNSYHNKQYEQLAKEAFRFFLHKEVVFLYAEKAIVVGNVEEIIAHSTTLEELPLVMEEEFFDFQNIIRECVGDKPVEPPIIDEDPRIAEIKRKSRYRDRLKAKQAAKSKNGVTLFTMLVSICCMGIGITPLNIGEMSYASITQVLQKYQEKEKYELDINSILAGADSKKIKPKYWITNSES